MTGNALPPAITVFADTSYNDFRQIVIVKTIIIRAKRLFSVLGTRR